MKTKKYKVIKWLVQELENMQWSHQFPVQEDMACAAPKKIVPAMNDDGIQQS